MAAAERSTALRRQQADDTRARLFAAAAEMFVDKGYHATTVEKIAARAGVAKGTFFLHFPTKDAVILELVKIQCGGAKKARSRAIDSGASPVECLRVTAMELGLRAGVSRNISRAVLAATLEDERVGDVVTAVFGEVHALMIDDALVASRRGLLAKGTDPTQLAGQLMVSYLGSVLYFASTPRARPLAEVLEPLVQGALASAGAVSEKKGKGHDSRSTNPGNDDHPRGARTSRRRRV
jgi:AcrR family transcriptional regulator